MSKSEFKFSLGSKVKDKITGYEGVITACTEWLYGCRRYVMQSQTLKDGAPVPSRGTDEDALELIEAVDNTPNKFQYELGSKVKDPVTTYTGLIVARTHMIYAENVYDVQSQELKDGSPVKPIGLSEGAVQVVVAAEPHVMRATGGPGDAPVGYTVGQPRG